MKVTIVGPSHPFRGGIAIHTTLLFRELRKRHEARLLAFRRQYPSWLFPGKSDRDSSDSPVVEPGTEHVLDSLNPWTWVKVARAVAAFKSDVLIMPWWTLFWTPQFTVIIQLLRLFNFFTGRRTKVLFECHNVYDHEGSWLSRRCARFVLRQGDHLMVHSAEDFERLAAFVPRNRITLGFLPEWSDCFGAPVPAAEAKRGLNLQGDTLLFFGFIRPYKGLDCLLRAMPRILCSHPVTLMIVGESWDGNASIERRVGELGLESHVRRFDGYIPNEEVGVYFSAADLVVLPYVSCSGSGIVQSAYGYSRPVVASRVGSLCEAVVDGVTGYLVEPENPEDLADAVLRYFREHRAEQFSENIRVSRERFSWRRLVEILEGVLGPDASGLGPAQSEAGSKAEAA